jgi:hypothetical protein
MMRGQREVVVPDQAGQQNAGDQKRQLFAGAGSRSVAKGNQGPPPVTPPSSHLSGTKSWALSRRDRNGVVAEALLLRLNRLGRQGSLHAAVQTDSVSG